MRFANEARLDVVLPLIKLVGIRPILIHCRSSTFHFLLRSTFRIDHSCKICTDYQATIVVPFLPFAICNIALNISFLAIRFRKKVYDIRPICAWHPVRRAGKMPGVSSICVSVGVANHANCQSGKS